jgi:hypothetical protein
MAQQPTLSGMFNGTLAVVGAVFGVASLLNYYDIFAHQGVLPALEALVARYREVVHAAFGPLDAPVRAVAKLIAGLIDVRIDVEPYWKDVFVPIGLYFASSARATHREGFDAYRYALYLSGVVIALIASVYLATLGATLRLEPALATLVTAVVLYELISFALLLLLVPKESRKGSPGFWRYAIERPLPAVLVGAITLAVFSIGFAREENTSAFALIFFIFLLGVRSMALATFFALENKGGWHGSFRERLFRSRSWILGVLVVATIGVATLGVAWGG